MKIPMPKNWRVIRRGFPYIEWQHGQRKVSCPADRQPRYDGWIWTSQTRILLKYNQDTGRWVITVFRLHHPAVTQDPGHLFLRAALQAVHILAEDLGKKYDQEEE